MFCTGVQSYCDLNTADRFWDLSSGGTETRTIYLPILPAENSLWNGLLNCCSHTTGVQCDSIEQRGTNVMSFYQWKSKCTVNV